MSLAARHVHITLGGAELVRDVSVECDPGEIVAIVGPNGAGKSMFLSALAGRREAAGSIRMGGRPLDRWERRRLARRRGVLRQRTHLPFAFPVRKVVELGDIPWRGAARGASSASSRDYLEAVGLEGFAERSYPTLSGGEMRRVQLARILFQVRGLEPMETPRWVLLDEPLSNLDIGESARVQGLIRRIAERGVGVVAVFHDLNAAAAVAETVYLLRDGACIAHGPPRATMTAEHLERCFQTDVRVTVDEGNVTIRAELNRHTNRGGQR